MDEFQARFVRMWRVCGPQAWPSLLASRSEIEHARDVHLGRVPAADAADRSRSEFLYEAACHPDTEDIIPLPFRMAAHVPVNTALLVGMLLSRTVLTTGLSQLANQSFNAAQFWSNRNASNSISTPQLIASYASAIAASVGVGVALRRWELRNASRLVGWRGWLLSNTVPLIAAAAAKPLQIGLMRSDELTEGVTIRMQDTGELVRPSRLPPSSDHMDRPNSGLEGEVACRSRVAGVLAVTATVWTRVVYLIPPMIIPQVVMHLTGPVLLAAGGPILHGVVFVATVATMSAITTPICMAIFSQQATIPAMWLEPEVLQHIDPARRLTARVVFNKGL